MTKSIYYLMIAGSIFFFSSCKNGSNNTQDPAASDTSAVAAATENVENPAGDPSEVKMSDTLNVMTLYSTSDNILVKPHGIIPNRENGLSGDAIEHEVNTAWPKLSIFVKQSGSKLNILDIFTSIVEVYPIPQLLEGWLAIDQSSGISSLGKFVCDEEKNFISGKWEDPDYGNNFALKAWEMMEDNQWMIGLVYNRLWDGDDGVGVYQNLMFWTYDANNEHILRPVDTTERFLPVYTPQRGIVVFRPDNDNLDFEDGADPSLFWKWNGYWFVSSAPQE